MVEQMAETFREDQYKGEEQMIPCETDVAVSVSFGRFENDLLSWERWSSFSQNKYLEEVEKCSTPGSVARKKAYFEAHYKKIAARKAAELLEQEQHQQLEPDSLRSNYPSNGNQTQSHSNFEFDLGCRNQTQNCGEFELKLAHADEPNQDAVGVNYEDTFSLRNKEEMHTQQHNLGLEKPEVAVLVQEVNPLKGSVSQSEEDSILIKEESRSNESLAEVEDEPHNFIKEENQSVELLPVLVKEDKISIRSRERFEEEIQSSRSQPETSTDHVGKAENTKVNSQRKPRKRIPAFKEKNPVKATKKPVTADAKPARTSVPRASKTAPASPVISTSRVSTRKENTPSILRNKNPSTTENKRSASTSLHMSFDAPPTNSNSSFLNTTRRSFIMEKMGDKEIVKRAFKTFQNTYDKSKSNGKGVSFTPQQESESSSMTPWKDKERTGTTLPKTSSQRKQVGVRPNSLSASPVKAAGVKQTSTKAVQTSTLGMRSDKRAEKKRLEVSKNFDEKPKAKEVEKTRLRSKSKEGADNGTNRRPMSWR